MTEEIAEEIVVFEFDEEEDLEERTVGPYCNDVC